MLFRTVSSNNLFFSEPQIKKNNVYLFKPRFPYMFFRLFITLSCKRDAFRDLVRDFLGKMEKKLLR